MELKTLKPFQSVAEVVSFIDDLGRSEHATPTLRQVLPPLARVVWVSVPGNERKLEFNHELRNHADRTLEKIRVKLSADGAFELEWHLVRDGRMARLTIESEAGAPFSVQLLYSPDALAEIANIVAWILANRREAEPEAALAAAG